MNKSDFFYDLPHELIAQHPLVKRDSSRLMVLDKETGERDHRHFYDIGEYLNPGDCLVINETSVIPARIIGEKLPGGGRVELLLLKDLTDDLWECIGYPGKKLRPGAQLSFGNGLLTAAVEKVCDGGNRVVRFFYDGVFLEVLDKLGEMPLPHYILEPLSDRERYQTVYAKHAGSAAAPTAGLHFTNELLAQLEKKGVSVVRVLLHIGLGTFRPVKEENIEMHRMHSEWYSISEEAANKINSARVDGCRVIAVGTTSCRTLETATDELGVTHAGSGDTDIFIYPGYTFKGVDAIITNFHLPESTLIMLISAFAGRENVLAAYKNAVNEKYRFFSFGDAMYIG